MTVEALRVLAHIAPDEIVTLTVTARAEAVLAAVDGSAETGAADRLYWDVAAIAAALGCSVSKVRGDFARGAVPDAYLFGGREWRTTPAGMLQYVRHIEEEGRQAARERMHTIRPPAAGHVGAEGALDDWSRM
jgi:hypothetical protein